MKNPMILRDLLTEVLEALDAPPTCMPGQEDS